MDRPSLSSYPSRTARAVSRLVSVVLMALFQETSVVVLTAFSTAVLPAWRAPLPVWWVGILSGATLLGYGVLGGLHDFILTWRGAQSPLAVKQGRKLGLDIGFPCFWVALCGVLAYGIWAWFFWIPSADLGLVGSIGPRAVAHLVVVTLGSLVAISFLLVNAAGLGCAALGGMLMGFLTHRGIIHG